MAHDLTRLMASGLLRAGAELYHPRRRSGTDGDIVARLTDDGIEVNGTVYKSVSTAAARVTGYPTNGWTFWRVRSTGVRLDQLRDRAPA